jgi:tRNA U55 pseudouridine synthase TruB
MANENLSLDEVRKLAADIGLTRLTDAHLQELQRATNGARARRATLNHDTLSYADEPSHVFSLNTGDAA